MAAQSSAKGKTVSSAVDKKEVLGKERIDVFKDVKPYYGSIELYEVRDKIPTLFSLAVQIVLDTAVDYQSVPPTLQNKLNHCKEKRLYKGPKIMKCSICSKYYSKQQKFLDHICV